MSAFLRGAAWGLVLSMAACACIPPVEEADRCAAQALFTAGLVGIALASENASPPRSYLTITDPPPSGVHVAQ